MSHVIDDIEADPEPQTEDEGFDFSDDEEQTEQEGAESVYDLNRCVGFTSEGFENWRKVNNNWDKDGVVLELHTQKEFSIIRTNIETFREDLSKVGQHEGFEFLNQEDASENNEEASKDSPERAQKGMILMADYTNVKLESQCLHKEITDCMHLNHTYLESETLDNSPITARIEPEELQDNILESWDQEPTVKRCRLDDSGYESRSSNSESYEEILSEQATSQDHKVLYKFDLIKSSGRFTDRLEDILNKVRDRQVSKPAISESDKTLIKSGQAYQLLQRYLVIDVDYFLKNTTKLLNLLHLADIKYFNKSNFGQEAIIDNFSVLFAKLEDNYVTPANATQKRKTIVQSRLFQIVQYGLTLLKRYSLFKTDIRFLEFINGLEAGSIEQKVSQKLKESNDVLYLVRQQLEGLRRDDTDTAIYQQMVTNEKLIDFLEALRTSYQDQFQIPGKQETSHLKLIGEFEIKRFSQPDNRFLMYVIPNHVIDVAEGIEHQLEEELEKRREVTLEKSEGLSAESAREELPESCQ